ncbi:Putative ribosomal protein L49/IMG2 [Septoria linicola]|uniref:Large ribosomal subunit protein mL49 n=1 Tax=Septoria linicola TaxID=215465 RepID=A0A9Q9EQC4_9PEZI|nr:Putative ribosomal protein L49/IMG2 [Septoria linicola]
MASATPMLSFLRPLGLPRPATVRHFLRYSTSTPCREAAAATSSYTPPREDANLIASRTADEAYPPRSMRSQPRPKESRASRRSAHPTKERHYPTRRPSHHQPDVPKLIPDPVEPLPEAESAPNLAYFVSRSSSNNLPIYHLRKRGGNLKMTRIKNIDGDKMILKGELCRILNVKKDDVAINSVTGHINLKGHWKPKIETFLRERRF